MTADSCIFCRIIAGTASAERVYEDDLTIAFMDAYPAADGHLLVVPRQHTENLLTVDADNVAAVAITTRRIAAALQQALTPDGIRVSQFNGRAAGQTVFHYHVHLVPIPAGRQIGHHGRQQADPARIAAIASRIRDAMA